MAGSVVPWAYCRCAVAPGEVCRSCGTRAPLASAGEPPLPPLLAGCRRASSSARAAAVAVDAVLAVGLVALVVVGARSSTSLPVLLALVAAVVTPVVLIAYLQDGRTPGRLLLGVRTVNVFTGVPLRRRAALWQRRASSVLLDVRHGRDPVRRLATVDLAPLPQATPVVPALSVLPSAFPSAVPATVPATVPPSAAPVAAAPSVPSSAPPSAPPSPSYGIMARPQVPMRRSTTVSRLSDFVPDDDGGPRTERLPVLPDTPHDHAGALHDPASSVLAIGSARAGGAGGVDDPSVRVTLDDGIEFDLRGAALVGRCPVPIEGEDVDVLVQVRDAARSVSKTHLGLRWDGEQAWVEDRHSTNGTTVVDPGGTWQTLEPGRPYPVAPGSCVELGDRRLLVGARADGRTADGRATNGADAR